MPEVAAEPHLEVPLIGNLLEKMGAKIDVAPDPALQPQPPGPSEPLPPAPDPIEAEKASGSVPESLFTPSTPAAETMPELPKESFKTEKAFVDYEKWRKHQAGLETKIKELQSSPKGETAPEADARIQQLEARLQEMSAIVEKHDIFDHPAIQAQVVQPMQAEFDRSGALLTEHGIDADAFQKAMLLKGKARTDALDSLYEEVQSPSVRLELMDAAARVKKLEGDRDAIIADRKGVRERLDMQDRANRHQAAQNQEKQLVNMVDMAFNRLRDEAGFQFLRTVEGDEKWNNGVQQVRNDAIELLTKNSDPQQLAAAAVLGRLAPAYQAAYLSERSKRIEFENELKAIKSSEPGLGGGSPSNGSGVTEVKSVRDLMATHLK